MGKKGSLPLTFTLSHITLNLKVSPFYNPVQSRTDNTEIFTVYPENVETRGEEKQKKDGNIT